MTTPSRIAAFLSTSALCLGLGASAAYAAPRGASPAALSVEQTRDEARGAHQGSPGQGAAGSTGDSGACRFCID